MGSQSLNTQDNPSLDRTAGAKDDIDFESDHFNPNNFGKPHGDLGQNIVLNHNMSGSDDLNEQTETVYDNDVNDEQLDDDQAQDAEVDGEGDEDEEGETVYMIDGVTMKMIQIEGEENQYLMDPEGRIYDFNANFIGVI